MIVNYVSVGLGKCKNVKENMKNECLFEIMSYSVFFTFLLHKLRLFKQKQ